MNDLGFSNQSTFDMSQIVSLILFVIIVGVIGLLLQRNKNVFKRWLANQKIEQICEVEVQNLNSTDSIYRLKDEKQSYLIFKTSSGIVLLDKQANK